MGLSIAITGKGGCGKTTLAACMLSALIENGCFPVLAIDADPNVCLDGACGVEIKSTVGSLREEAKKEIASLSGNGISKQDLFRIGVNECLVETERFDLLAMGRPEGPGCYCYANNVLRDIIRGLSSSYPCVLIDNEAGLENLSRRIVQHVDVLVIVGESSRKGRDTIVRLKKLADEMGIRYGKLCVIINRIMNTPPSSLDTSGRFAWADYYIEIPYDEDIAQLNDEGKSILSLAKNNSVYSRIDGFIKFLLNVHKNEQ